MTDQPNPDATDASLARAEELAAAEAAREATSDPGTPTAAAAESPKVTRAQPRTSQPAPGPTRTSGHETNGSGNGRRHREVSHASAENVHAETVSLHQASAQRVEADSIEIRQGAAARAAARDLSVTGGAVGFARADRVSVELGAAGAAVAREANVTQSAVNSIVARQANVEQSLVQTVVAADVRFTRPSAVVFLVSRRVEGDVRAILDWRGALVFGVVVGVVSSLLRRRR